MAEGLFREVQVVQVVLEALEALEVGDAIGLEQ